MMKRVVGGAAPEAEIRYRATLLQLTLPVFAATCTALAFVILIALRSAHPLTAAEVRESIGPIFVLASAYAYFAREHGITLKPGGMEVNKMRKRVIGWEGIADISIERELVYRVVIVRDVGGRRIRLPVPESYLDHGFDEKVRVIQSCWLRKHDWLASTQNSTHAL